jgi:hypothetical protein
LRNCNTFFVKTKTSKFFRDQDRDQDFGQDQDQDFFFKTKTFWSKSKKKQWQNIAFKHQDQNQDFHAVSNHLTQHG